MDEIRPASSYHAVIGERRMLNGGDGKTALKVYFIDIIDRDNPERTEWNHCGIDKDEFLRSFAAAPGVEGVGFVTAFPHITKVFRFGPENEVVMNVRAWNTPDLAPIDLARSDAYVEFACLAEAALAADEFEFWAEAETVEAYLATWSGYADGPIKRHKSEECL